MIHYNGQSKLKYWQEYSSTTFSHDGPVENQIIWNNCRILINVQQILCENWFKNVITINEINRKYDIEIPFEVFYSLIDPF